MREECRHVFLPVKLSSRFVCRHLTRKTANNNTRFHHCLDERAARAAAKTCPQIWPTAGVQLGPGEVR
jgi:hypothetical protein